MFDIFGCNHNCNNQRQFYGNQQFTRQINGQYPYYNYWGDGQFARQTNGQCRCCRSHQRFYAIPGPQGPRGFTGPQGVPGPRGPAGADGTAVVESALLTATTPTVGGTAVETPIAIGARIPLNTEVSDPYNLVTLNTATNTFTFNETGTYLIFYTVYARTATTGTATALPIIVGLTDGAGTTYGAGTSATGATYVPVTGTATVTVTNTALSYGLTNLSAETIYVGGANAEGNVLYGISRVNIIKLS